MELDIFLDASGSPSTSIVAVAALAFSPEKRLKFEREWAECLAAHDIMALHMKDFAHSRGEFASWKEDEPMRRRLLNGLLWIIEANVDYTATCGMMLSAYKAANAKYRLEEFMKPYTMASVSCALSITDWATQTGYQRDAIRYLFERGDNDQGNLRACWKKLIPAFDSEPVLLKKVDSHPAGSTPSRIRAFEAADLIAYENLKANMKIIEGGGTAFMSELRKPIQRMRTLPGSDLWRTMDSAANLEKLCQSWRVSARQTRP